MSENGVMSLMCPVLPHWGTGGSSCIVPTDTHVYRVLIHLQHSVQSSTIIHSFQPATSAAWSRLGSLRWQTCFLILHFTDFTDKEVTVSEFFLCKPQIEHVTMMTC